MGGLNTGRTKYQIEWADGVEQLRLPARRSWPVSAFLALWLVGWTLGGGAALAATDAMIMMWLGLWALGWCSALILLMGLVAAVDIIRVYDGKLVITRRAGPLARTWNYRIGALTNLRIDTTAWSGDGADGAEHFVLLKQQWGAVRFDHEAETIYLAPHVSEAEAERVFDWLKQRLPISASL